MMSGSDEDDEGVLWLGVCPTCRVDIVAEAGSNTNGDYSELPTHGDGAVCFNCGEVLEFRLVIVKSEDEELRNDDMIMEIRAKAIEYAQEEWFRR